MISKLKYVKGVNQYSHHFTLWENDTYMPSDWRPISKELKTRIRMRCFLTGRFKAVDRKFYLTRMPWKYFAKGGYIPGVKKASW